MHSKPYSSQDMIMRTTIPRGVHSLTLSIFPLRLCEKTSRAKAQRLRLIAETTIKAQLINWLSRVGECDPIPLAHSSNSGTNHLRGFHVLRAFPEALAMLKSPSDNLCKNRKSISRSTLSVFLLCLCEESSRAKA
jgi:hypothetical protein